MKFFWKNVKQRNKYLFHLIFGQENQLGKLVQKVPFAWKAERYKQLLVSSGSTSGTDKIPTEDDCENAEYQKITLKLGELNNLHMKIWSSNSSSVGKVTFKLVRNAKIADFSQGNSKIAWEVLVSKYAPLQPHPCWNLRVSSIAVSWSQLKKTPTSESQIWKG